MKARTNHWIIRSLLVLGLVLVALGAYVGVEYILKRGGTPEIVDDDGREGPGSLSMLERITLGGVEQYVLIRGHSRDNPVILFLHGGPGMPAMYLAHAFQRELERDFVVVHWDRRGAGKSYAAQSSTDTLTVRQTLNDTHELSRHLQERLGNTPIYLVGHSWGSYLGLLAVRERPDFYRAFVGTGQVAADAARTGAIRREFVLRSAVTAGDSAVAVRVRSGGSVTEDDLFRYGGELRGSRSFWPLLRLGMQAPEYTLFDILNVPRGAQRVGRTMRNDVIDGALDREVLHVEVPVAFFLGRYDYNTPSGLAAAYLEQLDAPFKRLIWFEESAHFPFLEEPEKFHAEMIRLHRALNHRIATRHHSSARF